MSLRFITTSDIAACWPSMDQRQAGPVAHIDRGDGFPVPTYSRGKLEKLLKEKHRVVVLSSRPAGFEHDAWWMEKLLPEDIHFLHADRESGPRSFTALCRKTVTEVYGLEWPNDEEGKPCFWIQGLDLLNKRKV